MARGRRLGLTVDVNAARAEYSQVARRVEQFPRLRMVLDHCGFISPDLAPPETAVTPVLEMAQYPHIYAKLTFLGDASRQNFPFEDRHWMARANVDAVGPERCMFGTCFPEDQFDLLFAYRQNVQPFAVILDLIHSERAFVVGGNAATLWHLG